MIRYFGVMFLAATLASPAVQAGKVETVRSVLKKECNRNVSYEEALVYVRALYLTCIPETMVHIVDVCDTKCLKSSSSSVGRN